MPPILMSIEKSSGNITYSGAAKDILDLLSDLLNFTYTFVEIDLSAAQKNGIFETLLTRVAKGVQSKLYNIQWQPIAIVVLGSRY